eukprot:TRINITY_DN28776_c0_g1_i1.p1 TRINITY_DN28776_c0_g1~~TRINITY_DN28776_c0_g1_i1.p1  ORF type:complete len:175 (-),score=27.58 TRINITY_DN28776_c0_g1_i1:185-709(-)
MQATQSGWKAKEVHESCFELLHIETVLHYALTSPEDCSAKLEKIGYSVGSRLVERYTRERGRFSDSLEMVKFICKEIWTDVFKKQVDNLKTNHKGIFVLNDAKYRALNKISASSATQSPPPVPSPAQLTAFGCGLIKGVLCSMGMPCEVSADFSSPNVQLPACNFTIKMEKDPR